IMKLTYRFITATPFNSAHYAHRYDDNFQIKGKQTLADWNNACRKVMTWKVVKDFENGFQIGGQAATGQPHIVELDETYFKKKNSGFTDLKKSINVFGGICPEQNKAFCYMVKDTKQVTLFPLVRKHVANRSVIFTD